MSLTYEKHNELCVMEGLISNKLSWYIKDLHNAGMHNSARYWKSKMELLEGETALRESLLKRNEGENNGR